MELNKLQRKHQCQSRLLRVIFDCMLNKTFTPVSSSLQRTNTMQEEEAQNPENIFAKLLSIPRDTPLRECKMLLESMKEEANFEKAVINRTRQVLIPQHRASEIKRSRNYQHYTKLLAHSKKQQDALDFDRKHAAKSHVVSKNRAVSLGEFVEGKKARLLTEESRQAQDTRAVEYLLSDDATRDQLFDESILLERLYYVRKQGRQVKEVQSRIPAKFRRLHPKHLRLPQRCRDEVNFKRRKYVHHQRTFQYFHNALKTQSNLLQTKEKENSLVIGRLMTHFSGEVMANQHKVIDKVHRCIRRLFLKYAQGDSEDVGSMFKHISRPQLVLFMETFGIDYKVNPRVEAILENHPDITQFHFLQILHLLSLREGDSFNSDIQKFLDEYILSHPQRYLPRQWVLYQQYRTFIEKHLKVRRFKEKMQLLYGQVGQEHTDQVFSFDRMVEVMWEVRVYPFMISKKKLRFFYLYSQTRQTGLTIQEIMDVFIYIALSREGKPEDNVREVVKKVVEYARKQP